MNPFRTPPELRDFLSETTRLPSYQQLSDYSHLVDPAKFSETTITLHGDLDQTKEEILRVVNENKHSVYDLAEHLMSKDLGQFSFNVWHWMQANFTYRRDTAGEENIRTPQRSLADRRMGIDCEDYTIFAYCLFLNTVHASAAALSIVRMKGAPSYGHIYLSVGKDMPWSKFQHGGPVGEIAVDRLTLFPYHPSNIAETMSMKITVLNGLSGVSDIAEAISSEPANTPNHRKLLYFSMLDKYESDAMSAVMPDVLDIDPRGFFVYRPGVNVAAIEEYLREVDMLRENTGLSGIRDLLNKLKSKLTKNKGKNQNTPRRGLFSTVSRITPVMIAARAAFLLMVSKNGLRYAQKLRLMYLTESQARAAKLNIPEWRKLAAQKGNVEKTFRKFGGKTAKLRRAIERGSSLQPGTLGLPDGGVTAAIAAAAPIITAVAVFLGRADYSKIKAGSDDAMAIGAAAVTLKDAIKQAKARGGDNPLITNPNGDDILIENADFENDSTGDDESGDNTLIWVGAAALAVVGAGIAMSQSSK